MRLSRTAPTVHPRLQPFPEAPSGPRSNAIVAPRFCSFCGGLQATLVLQKDRWEQSGKLIHKSSASQILSSSDTNTTLVRYTRRTRHS